MAKSIFELLDSLKTETSVPEVKDKKSGKIWRENMGMVKHTMPREKLPTSEQFEDCDKLLEWAKETGQLHQCLQSGIQARIIEYRAVFKAMPKKADLENGEVWSVEFGQTNVNGNEWKVAARPNQDNKKLVIKEVETLVKSIQTMLDLGLEIEVIKPKLLEKHNEQIVTMAIEMIG